MKKLLVVFMAVSIFAIVSCNSGGGGSSSPPPDPEPITEKPFIWGQSHWGNADWEVKK